MPLSASDKTSSAEKTRLRAILHYSKEDKKTWKFSIFIRVLPPFCCTPLISVPLRMPNAMASQFVRDRNSQSIKKNVDQILVLLPI